MSYSQYLSSIEDIIEDARNGRMFILVDDENRENEGDLVIPAQMATPEAVNFMAKYGRGLICLTLTGERIRQLGLPLMAKHNRARHETAFTVSIEAAEGVSTGISAHDRAHTIQVAIDPTKGAEDIVTPGHVFPLMAQDGGVLRRAGHTEAAVDISRLAGLHPSGVICEIMNDDGSMARLPDLVKFAQFHNLKIAKIADLIQYRRRFDNLIEKTCEMPLHTRFGSGFTISVYVNQIEYAEHVAITKGDVSGEEPVLVRMHAFDLLEDVLGVGERHAGILEAALREIDREGRGALVLIREPRATALSDRLKSLEDENGNGGQLRDYGIGAQILLDLGVRNMILLSNSKKNIIGLDGYGLSVVGQRPLKTL